MGSNPMWPYAGKRNPENKKTVTEVTERGINMRKPMITRTIETTVFEVFCIDTTTQKTETRTFTFSGRVKDTDKALKKLRKENETDTFKLVYVVNSRLEQKLYGMSEADFVAHAAELDENRKPIV